MVLDRNLITYVFAPSKATHGVTDIHLLTNPPTLEPTYYLLHSAHPDHYAIFLASPTDPPGDIIYGEVQVPGGLEVGRGQKAIILHQPEEIINIGDKVCRLGFKFDWTFEWEGKQFKWSRDCIAGIMKSMTLSYMPPREYKDDPPITLALFSASPSITLLDYNFPRIPIKDIKGFEVIILLFGCVFIDIQKHEGHGLVTLDVKKETQRLQKIEDKAEDRARRQKAEEVGKETERLRKLAHDEFMAKKKQDEEIEKETERLRWQEGWYNNDRKSPSPQRPPSRPPSRPLSQQGKKKHWWSINTGGEWSQRDGNGNGYQGYGPKYSKIGARMMGYSS